MNKTVIKELQKLMALCMEISDKTRYKTVFEYAGYVNWFCVSVHENGGETDYLNGVTGETPTLSNINKCRQKLLKYKEW